MQIHGKIFTYIFKKDFKEFNEIIAKDAIDFFKISKDEEGKEYISEWLNKKVDAPSNEDLNNILFEDYEHMHAYYNYVRRRPHV